MHGVPLHGAVEMALPALLPTSAPAETAPVSPSLCRWVCQELLHQLSHFRAATCPVRGWGKCHNVVWPGVRNELHGERDPASGQGQQDSRAHALAAHIGAPGSGPYRMLSVFCTHEEPPSYKESVRRGFVGGETNIQVLGAREPGSEVTVY